MEMRLARDDFEQAAASLPRSLHTDTRDERAPTPVLASHVRAVIFPSSKHQSTFTCVPVSYMHYITFDAPDPSPQNALINYFCQNAYARPARESN